MASVDNSLQVNFEKAVEAVYSGEQLLADDANSLLLGELIIQNFDSKEKISTYLADDDLAKRVEQFIVDFLELITRMCKQKAKLQQSLDSKGVDLKVAVIFFNNWSWTIIRLLFLVKPITREDVVAVVNSCTELKIKVKMGAAGFKGSWPPVFPDNGGLLFNTKDLVLSDGWSTKIFNQAKMEVTISPGVIERHLQHFFIENNICFESDVIINSVTYGGVVSSGSHGTGKDQKSVSDFLTELKIVNGHGQIVTYGPQTQSQGGISAADIVAAAKVNLGLFGIAVEYTFKVVPMKYVLYQEIVDEKVSDVFSTPEKIQALWEKNWSLEILFFPFLALWYDWCKGSTEVPYYDAPVRIRIVNDPISLPDKGVDPLQFGEAVVAEIVKRLELNDTPVKFDKLPKVIHFFNTMQWFPMYAMEFCFPYSSERVKQAMDAVLNVTKSKQSVLFYKLFPWTLFIDTRFIQHSDTLLCPAVVGQETIHSFYIQVLPLRIFYSIDTIRDYYSAIAEQWFKLGGVPHWHKEWSYLPDVNAHLHKVYGWRLMKFEEVRKTLDVDPNNLFRNETMTKLFDYVP